MQQKLYVKIKIIQIFDNNVYNLFKSILIL